MLRSLRLTELSCIFLVGVGSFNNNNNRYKIMERYARDIENGNYSPTFFTIRIPNEENYENLLANERMSEQAEAYFLHEYIHFLQDLKI